MNSLEEELSHVRICISVKAYTEKRQKTKLEFDTDIYLRSQRYMELMMNHVLWNLSDISDDTLIDMDAEINCLAN